MFSVKIRQKVQVLRRAGKSPKQVQALCGVSPSTQRRIIREPWVDWSVTDAQFRRQRKVGRPTVLLPEHRQFIGDQLKKRVPAFTRTILRQLIVEHAYQRSRTAVYDFAAAHRPLRRGLPEVRFEGVPGEFGQHDFSRVPVCYTEAPAEVLTFYAAKLKYSRMIFVRVCEDQRTETVVRGMLAFAEAMGGLPLINVWDNAKTIVSGSCYDFSTGRRRLTLHSPFALFMQECEVLAEPCHPAAPNQKGAVEHLIGWVKRRLFKAGPFRNRAHLVKELEAWTRCVNHSRVCKETGRIPADLMEVERPWLRPIPFTEASYGIPDTRIVNRQSCIRWEMKNYSVPHRWIGQPVRMRVFPEEIRIYAHGQEIVHPRMPDNGRYSLLPEHRAAFFHKPRGAVMAKRQILMDLCPEAQWFFTELVHRRPLEWRERDLPVLWSLFERHGGAWMKDAFRECVRKANLTPAESVP